MSSWRDSASSQAQADLDALLDAVLSLAEEQVRTAGEFYPFGATVTTDGEIVMVAAAGNELGDQPESQIVLDQLYAGVQRDRDVVRAAAFVANVRIDGGDAVRAELEHTEGAAMVVVLPYSRSRLRKQVTFGQLRAASPQPHIWHGS